VVQGTAVATVLLNVIALWRQEKPRPMTKQEREAPRPKFSDAWADFASGGTAGRLLLVVFLGTMAFNMQDVLLEPYGGEILGLSVSATTLLTAIWSAGALVGFGYAARQLAKQADPYRLASKGLLAGIGAFSLVIFSAPIDAPLLFYAGACAIGFGGGLFAISTLTAAMTMPAEGKAGRGLALGAWGAAQATAAGVAIFIGGAVRDVVQSTGLVDLLGPATGYSMVYHIEIALLFATLATLGPLVRTRALAPQSRDTQSGGKIGLADLPT
jgi:BCD family chlorophyll transporter-like MFS transporter